MARKKARRKAKAARAILVHVDPSLYERLDRFKGGQTVTAFCRELIIFGAEEEHARRTGQRLDLASGGGR